MVTGVQHRLSPWGFAFRSPRKRDHVKKHPISRLKEDIGGFVLEASPNFPIFHNSICKSSSTSTSYLLNWNLHYNKILGDLYGIHVPDMLFQRVPLVKCSNFCVIHDIPVSSLPVPANGLEAGGESTVLVSIFLHWQQMSWMTYMSYSQNEPIVC